MVVFGGDDDLKLTPILFLQEKSLRARFRSGEILHLLTILSSKPDKKAALMKNYNAASYVSIC